MKILPEDGTLILFKYESLLETEMKKKMKCGWPLNGSSGEKYIFRWVTRGCLALHMSICNILWLLCILDFYALLDPFDQPKTISPDPMSFIMKGKGFVVYDTTLLWSLNEELSDGPFDVFVKKRLYENIHTLHFKVRQMIDMFQIKMRLRNCVIKMVD